jgi:SAM-dependent methyltransferase
LQQIKDILPSPVKRNIRAIINFGKYDLSDIVKNRDLPPRKIRNLIGAFDSASYYRQVQNEFFGYFQTFCALKPSDNMLDIGCGCGQMASPLASYLTTGKYEGVDIMPILIDWCKKKIIKPNFSFKLADVYSDYYNPTGRYQSSEYVFPYPDASFNFIFGKSLFTHMLPADVENYFVNISRVIREGGVCLFSYFLLNEESLKLMASGKSGQVFKFNFGVYRTITDKKVEAAVSYNEQYYGRCTRSAVSKSKQFIMVLGVEEKSLHPTKI